MNKYLTDDVLLKELDIDISKVSFDDLGSNDTYNEEVLLNLFKKMSKGDRLLLFKAALNISLIGSGGQSFGFIKDGEKVIELKDLFKQFKVRVGLKLNDKINEDDITPRRLTRIFRNQIMDFIKRTNMPSYLWRKYSKRDMKMVHCCFPGAEHLLTEKVEIDYLLDAYKTLDKALEITLSKRIERVLVARGMIKFI